MVKILIIDIETTGFTPKTGKIVEIGIVELDLANGEKKIIFDQVVHESGITIEELEKSWIVKNSSLTVEMIIT
jgi:DNA polymerase III epsilon subunit-like protein